MQQREQPGVAVGHRVGLGDPGPDHAGIARQAGPHPIDEGGLGFARQMALAALVVHDHKPGEAMFGIEHVPGAHRAVVHQQGRGDLGATPAAVQELDRIGPARHPRLAQPIMGKGAKFAVFIGAEETRTNHPAIRIASSDPDKPVFGKSMSRSIKCEVLWVRIAHHSLSSGCDKTAVRVCCPGSAGAYRQGAGAHGVLHLSIGMLAVMAVRPPCAPQGYTPCRSRATEGLDALPASAKEALRA